MSKTQSQSSSAGIGFSGALTILFIALKLCGVITWSWWWVLAPLWIGAVLAIGVVAFVLFAMAVTAASIALAHIISGRK